MIEFKPTHLALIFLAIGLLMLTIGGYVALRVYAFISTADTADGLVIRMADGSDGMSAPVVRYFLPNGEPVTFQSSVQSNPPAYRVEERVVVRYDPADPENATIVGWQEWFAVFVVSGIGGVFTFLGTLFYIVFRRAGLSFD